MEMNTFGETGVVVSKYCLGAMMFGAMGNTDHDECVGMVHRALDAGINFIDTADAYSMGESEEVAGRALAGRRDEVVLATKAFIPMGTDPNHRGGSRRWLVRAVEDSLRRLDTDHIDLFQLHRRDTRLDLDESLGALDQLVRDGKILYAGMSATPAEWSHLATAWAAEHPAVASVIIGPRTPEQLDDALASADVRLDESLLDALDELLPPGRDIDTADTSRPEPHMAAHARRRRR